MSRKYLAIALLFAAALPARGSNLDFYSDANLFRLANLADGKVPKGTETFEESNVPMGGKAAFPGPLCPGLPQLDAIGVGFPTGLAEDNLCIYDNITPGPAPALLNPSGLGNALYVIGPGFIGSNSKKVGEDVFLSNIQASLDLVFNPFDHKTGVGFNLSRFDGFPTGDWIISVFDINNNFLGMTTVLAPALNEPAKLFFGVWSPIPIGRINVYDKIIGPDAIDNIEMWVPEPMTLGYLALGAMLALRRRTGR